MLILLPTVLLSTVQVNNELLRTCEAEVTAYVKAKKHGIIWIIDGRVGCTEWVQCRMKRYQAMKLEKSGAKLLRSFPQNILRIILHTLLGFEIRKSIEEKPHAQKNGFQFSGDNKKLD